MRSKTGNAPAARGGVKKTGSKVASANTVKASEARRQKPGLQNATDFLKQRLGKKVKELQSEAGNEDSSAMSDAAPPAAVAAAVPVALDEMRAEAARRAGDYTRQAGVTEEDSFAVSGFEGLNNSREAENNRRKFFAELRKVVVEADVVIEVLDARDPASCRSLDLEKEVCSKGKRLVLLLNKIDLVPKHAVEAWLKHFQRSHPAIAFKAAHGGATRPVHAATSLARASEGLLRSTHAVVGADELMQLLKNYARTGEGKSKAHVTVGVVGYPNTGKSSVINSMKRTSAVEVGGKAGVTKQLQEVSLDSKITLIDSPGVVFEGASDDPAVILRNVIRVENITDPVSVVEALLAKAPREEIAQFYSLQGCNIQSVGDFIAHVARARGKFKRGKGLDLPSAAKSIISDWTTGKFRYFVMPPAESQANAAEAERETAEVVSSLAPALDLDALLDDEGEKPAVLGAPSAGPGADADMADDDL